MNSKKVMTVKDTNNKMVKTVTDKKGETIVLTKYNRIYEFEDGLMEVELNGKRGLLNDSFDELIPPKKYDDISMIGFNNILAEVYLNRKKGLLDKNLNEVLSPKYDQIIYFSNGFTRADLGEKIIYFDEDFHIVYTFE